ncbi:MAG: hypothetical protein H0V68_01775 [Actinobacteria bacterium]|nr:hypothetical protein [Actinomycetota bacterium]
MRNLKSRVVMLTAVTALGVGAFAPGAVAAHKYNVTTGNGSCQQLGGNSAAGTSNKGLDRAEENGNGKIQGGLCPVS